MTFEELRERANGSTDTLWWTYRFLRAAIDRHARQQGAVEEDALGVAVDCFLRLAQHDPDWAAIALEERGPSGHGLATLLSAERLDSALSRLQLPSTKEDAMLRARLLSNSARWQDLRGNGEAVWLRAWTELVRVPEAERDDAWKKLALGASAVADYPCYRALALEQLESLSDPFWRAQFLRAAVAVAFRHKDWPTFDAWLAAWRALPEPMRQGHNECAVLNLEGLRAVDEGRHVEAEDAMRRLVDAAQGVEFLSNADTSALPKRLRAEGRALALCDAFDALVKRLDWRLVAR
jgi:hypothetical protein